MGASSPIKLHILQEKMSKWGFVPKLEVQISYCLIDVKMIDDNINEKYWYNYNVRNI